MFNFFKKNSLFRISRSERNNFCEEIISSSAPRLDFYFLVILSTLIVALGLIRDNVILVIGGMLVTPLLSPLMAIALGLVTLNLKVILRSLRIFFVAFCVALLIAFLIGTFSEADIGRIGLIKMMEPSLYSFVVALVAGTAASYTWAKPSLNSNLPGVAIAITLIPPLTAIGLALGNENWTLANLAFRVLLINIGGILLVSMAVFLSMEFHKSKKHLTSKVKEEEKTLS